MMECDSLLVFADVRNKPCLLLLSYFIFHGANKSPTCKVHLVHCLKVTGGRLTNNLEWLPALISTEQQITPIH